MILLDMTVVNVALPRIQDGLGFSASGLAWVVNGYVLAAGGLLMLGGRLADVFGRRRLLLIGVVVFGLSSAVSGAAEAPWMMVVGRFGQGAAEAIAAPASLGLIALLFTDPKERTKALGVWGGIIGLGGTLGYVISGVLTDLVSWRWIFFINLPVALVALVLVPRLVTESQMVRAKDHSLDIIGAVTLTLGLVGVVYGLLQAAEHSWGSTAVVVPIAAGAALLLTMLLVERRARNPLIPLGFFANRTRSVVNFVTLFFMAAFISYTFMLTLFEQQVLDYSPLVTGLAWLPLSVGIGGGIALGTALIPRLGVRVVTGGGFIGAGVGLFLTSTADVDSSYVGGIMPGMLVFGLFAGATMPAATNAALHGVTVQDSSLASGLQNTMQQIGGALGVAVLVTLALRHADGEIRLGTAPEVAMTEGYTLAFRIGAALMVIGGLLVMALIERVDTELRDPMAESLAESR
ncbi:MFS transporter [Streptomyces cahuitamycinicus]|uniref:MFS transporter n=2 Tax=Streptomyces cahuitamycinicus TaxID=2070367 RepID=A0A2N8TXX2_9ACTN|nr:MFS transporter [Streptomyces cahuitamycinicus]PNG23854.1 MFS transporter [Streptomyces cahuitamycinicus]